MQAGLDHGAAAPHHLDAGVERVLLADAFDRDIDADVLFGLRLDFGDEVCAFGIVDAGADVPALDRAAPRRVGLGHEDFGGTGGMRAKSSKRTDRSRTRDQYRAAGLNAAAVDSIERYSS